MENSIFYTKPVRSYRVIDLAQRHHPYRQSCDQSSGAAPDKASAQSIPEAVELLAD
jgi:hypothetical protein